MKVARGAVPDLKMLATYTTSGNDVETEKIRPRGRGKSTPHQSATFFSQGDDLLPARPRPMMKWMDVDSGDTLMVRPTLPWMRGCCDD